MKKPVPAKPATRPFAAPSRANMAKMGRLINRQVAKTPKVKEK